MTPEEEHDIAHGSYVRRKLDIGRTIWYEWKSWTPSGEVTISEELELRTWPEEVPQRKPKSLFLARTVS